jgi:hypothetical protein
MGKPKAGFYVRFSPHAAAIDAMAEDRLHYKLTLPKKRDMLGKLRDYPHAGMIERGIVKQETHFNPLSITYFPHFWSVPAGGMRTPKVSPMPTLNAPEITVTCSRRRWWWGGILYPSGIFKRIVYAPGFVGSPSRTANWAPEGKAFGAAPQRIASGVYVFTCSTDF